MDKAVQSRMDRLQLKELFILSGGPKLNAQKSSLIHPHFSIGPFNPSPCHVSSTAKMLNWPKSLFRFSIRCYRKNPNKPLGQPHMSLLPPPKSKSLTCLTPCKGKTAPSVCLLLPPYTPYNTVVKVSWILFAISLKPSNGFPLPIK